MVGEQISGLRMRHSRFVVSLKGGEGERLTILRLTSDQTAHSYQYTFEPNKKWSGFYAPAKEIREYIGAVAEKYGANRFIKLQHKVTDCTWDDNQKQW